jgi:hypothetical protein
MQKQQQQQQQQWHAYTVDDTATTAHDSSCEVALDFAG